MVTQGSAPTRRAVRGEIETRGARRDRPRSSRVGRVVVFIAAAGAVVAYALPGGAYDIVVRQEYGIALWFILALGFGLGLLPRARPTRPALLLIAALSAYAAWTAASLAWSDSSERTVAEIARVLDYLGLVVLIVSVLDRGSWRAAAMGLGFAALAICALGVASRLVPGAFPAGALNALGVTNRLNYPFGYWNAVGAWAAMSIAIGLVWSAHDPALVRRAVALGLVPVAALAAYLSYSRASVGGVALAVIASIALSRNRITALLHAGVAAGAAAIAILVVRSAPQIANGTGTHGAGGVLAATALAVAISAVAAIVTAVLRLDRVRTPRNLARATAAAGAVVLVVAAATLGPRVATKAWDQFRHPAVVQSATDPASRLTHLGGTRYFYWRAALAAFRAKPITGTGAGTFEFWWDQHGLTGDFIRNAHSFELENMAELGVPGLLLIVAIMAAGLTTLVRSRRRSRRASSAGASAALLAAFLVYLLHASVDWMWQSTAVTVLALGGAGVAAARLSAAPRAIRWYARIGIVLLALGAALVQVPGLVSTAELRRSQAAEGSGNAALAYSWANSAVSAEPWAASPYEQRGLVLESAGRLAPAAVDLRRAIAREPDNYFHWLLLARIETERGHIDAATRDYLRARQLRPHASVFLYAPYLRAQLSPR